MIRELLGKIKNKPNTNEQTGAIQQTDNLNVSSDNVHQNKEEMIMEQIKMLIEINKTLNNKVKSLETRAEKLEQMLSRYAQLVEHIMGQKTAQSAPVPPQAPITATQQANVSSPAVSQPTMSAPPAAAQTSAPTSFIIDDVLDKPAQAPIPQNNHPLYKNADEKDFFRLHDGTFVRNSIELLNSLKMMDDNVFNYYVNQTKNDFSTWMRYCLKNDILASEIAKTSSRAGTIRVIESFI